MANNEYRSFLELFQEEQNPYGAGINPPDALMEPVAAVTPQACFDLATAPSEIPFASLGASSDGPVLMIGAVRARTRAPGLGPAADYLTYLGDFAASGVSPAVAPLANEDFHLVPAAVRVNGIQEHSTAMAALPDGQDTLPSVAAGTANSTEERTRYAYPIPYEHVPALIQLWNQGNLTWRRVWSTVGDVIRADAAQLARYPHFMSFLRVASTQLPGAAAGDPDLVPTTVRVRVPDISARGRDVAATGAAQYLGGWMQPHGVAAQMQAVTLQNRLTQQGILALQNPPPKGLDTKHPVTAAHLLALTGKATVAELCRDVPVWKLIAEAKAAAQFGILQTAMNNRALQAKRQPVLLSPSLATDTVNGQFTAPSPNRWDKGASIFRLTISSSNEYTRQERANEIYQAVALHGGANGEVVDYIIANTDFPRPDDAEDLRNYGEAYQTWLDVHLGERAALTVHHQTDFLDKLSPIINMIRGLHSEKAQRRMVYLIILMHHFRATNGYLMAQLQRGGSGPPADLPDYEHIVLELQRGRAMEITTLPDDMLRPAPAPAPPPGPQPPTPPLRQPRQQQQPPSQRQQQQQPPPSGQRAADNHPVQAEHPNQALIDAWTQQQPRGINGIFSEGSPYRDTSQLGNRAAIPSDDPNIDICIPMALRGVCYARCRRKHGRLSGEEVNRVAERGGLRL